MKTILLIDECSEYREDTASLLNEMGYEVWEAASSRDALRLLAHEKFDLVVCDLHLPLHTGEHSSKASVEVGMKTVRELKFLAPEVSIIAVSEMSRGDLKRLSRFIDPIPTYSKPLPHEQIVDIIDSHLNVAASLNIVQ